MSGICGYLNSPAKTDVGMLETMTASLLDNDRDKAVSATAAGSGVASAQPGAVAHRGSILAVIQGQPRWSDTDLSRLAENAGHAVAAAQAFEQFDQDFLRHLHGSFAVAILEPEKHHALLAVDRLGIRPLAFNTGRTGLGSSTVTGLLAESGDHSADAFGIGFSAEGYDEMAYARITAKRFSVKLHEYYVTPDDVTGSLPSIAKAYDEPFGNASALPAYYCAKFAKEAGKRVLLAGDGGDEIFAGNARYAKQKVFELYYKVPRWFRAGVLEPLLLGPAVMESLPVVRKARSYVRQALIPMPDRMTSYNFLHRTPLDTIFTRDLLNLVNVEAPMENIRDAYHRADTDSLLKRMLQLDLKITLADNDLRKVNRMCDLAGIDVRYPMLDERLMEVAARVPSSMLLERFELRSFYAELREIFSLRRPWTRTNGLRTAVRSVDEGTRSSEDSRLRQPGQLREARVSESRLSEQAHPATSLRARRLLRRDDMGADHAGTLAAGPWALIRTSYRKQEKIWTRSTGLTGLTG